MKFIVSGSQGLFLIDNGKKSKLRGGHIYGVSFDANNIFCAQRVKGTNIVRLNKNFKKISDKVIKGGHVHQCHFDTKTQHLFVTMTCNDELLRYDPFKQEEIARYKWAKSGDHEHHMNSVWRCQFTEEMYVYEHNIYGKHPKYTGGILRLGEDYKPVEKWEFGDKGHGIALINGWMYIADSNNERIVRKCIHTGEEQMMVETKEYPKHQPRGLAISDDYILVGMTELASRRTRGNLGYGLVIVYDKNFNKLDCHSIATGQIYEVRFIDRPDYAHNGIVFHE